MIEGVLFENNSAAAGAGALEMNKCSGSLQTCVFVRNKVDAPSGRLLLTGSCAEGNAPSCVPVRSEPPGVWPSSKLQPSRWYCMMHLCSDHAKLHVMLEADAVSE